MAGVRSKDQKGGIVPYVSAPNSSQPSAAAGKSSNYTKDYQGDGGKWGHDVGAYFGNEGGSGQGKNYSPGPGNYGPSASGGDFGFGGGKTGGNGFSASAPPTQRSQQPRPNGYPVITNTATSGIDFQPTAGGDSRGNGYGPFAQNGNGPAPQNFPQRSHQPAGPVSDGYPVINNDRGNGGGYIAPPEPVRRNGGSEPNGWITNGVPGYQPQQQGGNGKTFGNGGGDGGGYGSHGYGGQNGSLSGSEKHHHHHYYYNNNPVPYYNNNPQVEEKKRRRGASALAAALIACWACTCCCHAPCGC